MKRAKRLLWPSASLKLYRRFGKRILDVVVAVPVLVLSVPALLAGTISVWLQLGRPVLFRQERPGLHGSTFDVLKLRTMSEPTVSQVEDPDSARITRLGSVLRRLSIDEIPQLWNVICGEMSLVGPRPLLTDYLDLYTPEQARRHDCRPGMTGWAQIKGRNNLAWDERLALDCWYVDHVSLLLDLRILAITGWQVLKGSGVSAPGHATMPRFEGSDDG